jgi:tRNA (guanosine-2'-O-)-methyltransferase
MLASKPMTVRNRIRNIKHLQNKNFICVLEMPKDVKNIASAIRNISAFGVEKLYVIGGTKVVRNFESARKNKRLKNLSAGANKWVFVKHFDTTAECIKHLRKDRYTVLVTSSHEKGKKNVILYKESFTQKRLAIFFGNESKGVSEEAIEAADMCIQIPMGGIVESLNLGTSTGIILSYISYQRLKFVYRHKKVRFKPRGFGKLKMRSWEEFYKMNR